MREEGRWEGSDVAKPPLPPPVPPPGFLLPQLGAPQPFLINGPRLRAGAHLEDRLGDLQGAMPG